MATAPTIGQIIRDARERAGLTQDESRPAHRDEPTAGGAGRELGEQPDVGHARRHR